MKKFINYTLMIMILMLSIVSVSAIAAYNDGYTSATTLTSNVEVTTDKITSATTEKWYKFTCTTADSAVVITLKNTPSLNAYDFDLRYQADSTERPKVLKKGTEAFAEDSVNHRQMTLVLPYTTGTYYIKVYSLNGTTSNTPYSIEYTVDLPSHTANFTRITGSTRDWSTCAEMLAKDLYKKTVSTVLPDRDEADASVFARFGSLDGTANARRQQPDKVISAAEYIYSDDYMVNSPFELQNNVILSLRQMFNMIFINNRTAILCLNERDPDSGEVYDEIDYYVMLQTPRINDSMDGGQNIGVLEVYDPLLGYKVNVPYHEFLLNGYSEYDYAAIYTGTNIVCKY